METYIHYEHHGALVWVRSDLVGKHQEHCLCHCCANFTPENRATNCPRANLVYALDVMLDMVTPVWECPAFETMPTR